MDNSRRKLLQAIAIAFACLPFQRSLAALAPSSEGLSGNFQAIYDNPQYRGEFFKFLENVFHLYPETQMHQSITLATQRFLSDKEIYRDLQSNLGEIKPFLSELTYQIPALNKQKKVIAGQTVSLLDSDRRYEGYLEVGTTGRYLDALEEELNIVGERHFISERPATYAPPDMIDRGQVFKAGTDTALNHYRPNISQNIASNSIDLVTVYIGFHHCPVELREEFIGSIRDAMSPSGVLILRDHNVHNRKMERMVALAHDVFNMGTNESWKYNSDELRNFYSLAQLDEMLVQFGFSSNGIQLFQDGDPTKNALMMYKKS